MGIRRFAKGLAFALTALLLFPLFLMAYQDLRPIPEPGQVRWGLTFSQQVAEDLKIPWREAYLATLDDLDPAHLRLIAYWNRVEPEDGRWDFADLDWQIAEAAKRGIPVTLAVGQKVPRWPECHYPTWIGRSSDNLEPELIEYVTTVIGRYRQEESVRSWQVENEPFLAFGDCPAPDPARLDRETVAARAADPTRPITLTDGGEWGDWYRAMRRADRFGTTLYRKVYNPRLGTVTLPYPATYYAAKSALMCRLAGKPDLSVEIAELGMEPWGNKQIYAMTPDEARTLFSAEDFDSFATYARATRMTSFSLWGAEWWYAMRLSGDATYWEKASALIAGGGR